MIEASGKRPWLERLCDDGFYLIDLMPHPVNSGQAHRRRSRAEYVPDCVQRASQLNPDGIVVVKKDLSLCSKARSVARVSVSSTTRPSPSHWVNSLSGYPSSVAVWDPDVETTHPLDFRLVQSSFVTMFWRSSLLEEAVEWLRSHAYAVVAFDAGAWNTKAAMFADVAQGLSFPDCFGHNLDALNDCLSDVASGEYGWGADDSGLVVVLKGFDAFTSVDRRTAQTMLDIIASQARQAILIGNRILCLVQSNDPQLRFDPVGAMPVVWNDAEWQDVERRGLREGN